MSALDAVRVVWTIGHREGVLLYESGLRFGGGTGATAPQLAAGSAEGAAI